MDPDLRASLVAGVLAGAAGLVAFTLLHVLLVAPLWNLLLIGLLPALFGGLWVGWAYHELREAGALPPGRLHGPAFGALLWLALLPLELLAVAAGPMTGVRPQDAMRNVGPEVLLAGLGAALIGWVLTRHPRRALAMGLAGLFLALPVAGTLVAFGGTGFGATIFAGMLLVYAVSGAVLAEVRPLLSGATRAAGAGAGRSKP